MIEIKLLSNRRFIYANRNQNIVITAENNATEIMVEFPDDYIKHSKRVDFVNSQGKAWTEALFVPEYKQYAADFNQLIFTFTLPNEVTTPGELKMQFVAYKPDESLTVVPFEVVPIYVDEAMACFKKNSKSNPDLLILSYNQSTEALFNSQQSNAKVKQIEEKSQSAADIASAANTAVADAVALLEEGVQIAKDADATARTALETAGNAKQTAGSAINAADEASAKAHSAVETAEQSKTTANSALSIAETAESKAAQALGIITDAKEKSDDAAAAANAAKQTAQAADAKAVKVEGLAEQAKLTAQTAESKAEQAVATADNAVMKADAAKSQGEYAKSKAEYAGERSDEAVGISNDASVLATQAKNKAVQAEQTAVTAQNLVTTAISDSANALAIATGIDAKAQTAIERSQQAKDASTKAEANSETAVATADAAKLLIENANITAQSANETALKAESKAGQASAVADRAETAADEAMSMAIAAEGKASTALTRSNEAKVEAAQAKQDAEQVRISAVKAEESAQEAKESAGIAIALFEQLDETLKPFAEEIDIKLESKVDKEEGKVLSSEDYTAADRNKLAGIATGANAYTHPASHPPGIITQDASNRFVSDTEKSKWNAKAETAKATQTADGLMGAADKAKLDGIAAGAQVNVVTSVAGKTGAVTLAKSDVGLGSAENTSDADKPVSNAAKTALDNKVDKISGKQLSTEDYTSAEKTKLAGIAAGAQVNTVTGIKGDSETNYRTGNVNISPANIGAEPVFSKNGAFNKNFGSGAGTVCEGNDGRLSNSRPASDVSAWAKAASKPTYTASEVSAIPTGNIDNSIPSSPSSSRVPSMTLFKALSDKVEGGQYFTLFSDTNLWKSATITAVITGGHDSNCYSYYQYTVTIYASGVSSAGASIAKRAIGYQYFSVYSGDSKNISVTISGATKDKQFTFGSYGTKGVGSFSFNTNTLWTVSYGNAPSNEVTIANVS